MDEDPIVEMARIDAQIRDLIERYPGLEEVYVSEMSEGLDEVVCLPRMPTEDDWARAEKLARYPK